MRLSSLFLLALLVACSPAPAPLSTPTLPPSLPPTSTPLPTLTLTPTPLPPTSTPTLVPTITPTPNPMSIAVMRQASYPGSDITLEQELDPGANYHRYYSSYLSQGLKIYALLTVPNGDPPPGGWPAIVFNHGYIPPKQYRTTERYIAYVDWLARAGYVVFRIDYRGNASSEGQSRGAYGDPGYTVDVLNAVASLQRYPSVDPQKIGMWGHSMGGFLTLRAMVISPAIKAGVIWAGVVGTYADIFFNWHHFGPTPTPNPDGFNWRQTWMSQYGDPRQDSAFWDSVTSNAWLSDLSGPLQLHHSLEDSEVPVAFSESLAQQVQAAGGTVELYTYPGDDHNLANSFSLAMTRTIQFYDKFLK